MFKVFYKKKDKLWIRVSKKVSKKAVIRNKLRRQVREIVRTEFPNRDMSDTIISVLPEAKDVPFAKLKENLLKRLR